MTAATAFVPGLDVLNAAEGHLSFLFDNANSKETIEARKVIRDMLKRGYAVFVELEDGSTHRVKQFSAKHDCYIIHEKIPETERQKHERAKDGKKAKPKVKERKIPLKKARATGVAPTAGG